MVLVAELGSLLFMGVGARSHLLTPLLPAALHGNREESGDQQVPDREPGGA